jgi:membrane protease YdiL (CAAX protease family)
VIAGRAPDFSSAEQLVAQPVSILPILLLTLITGPVAEEYGWRGYLHDRLHARFGMFVESLIIGLIWAVWHLPLFYMVGMSSYEAASFWLFVLYHIPLAMLFTWLFVGTGKSMMAVILFHFVHNLTLRFLSPDLTYRLLFMIPIALALSVKWLRTSPDRAAEA